MIRQLLNKLPCKPSAKPPTSSPLPPPHLRDALDAPALFLSKLALATTPSDPAADNELKRQTLLDLTDYVSSSPGKFPDAEIQSAVLMVSTNIFRPLPAPSPTPPLLDPAEEPPPPADPAWPHLQLVYEFLLRLVVSPDTDAKLAKRYIHHPFLLRFLDLFNSEDHRERDYLKTILHRIYGKFMLHRPFIRKAINNIFYTFIFETESHNGIAELLEVIGSIINGFALPLKEEHKTFLMHVLLPLHKPRCVSFYHHQLCFCVVQFVEKDPKLADVVIRGLLRCWPVTDSAKEVMFIGEVEQILEVTQEGEFERCMVPLFRQIGRCISSSSFQVAERALYIWNNDLVRNLITQNKKVILPIVFPALERTAREHWNQSVQTLTLNVRQLFLEADRDLFEECVLRFHDEAGKEISVQEKRDLTWKRLEEVAASRAVSKEPVLVSRAASFKMISSPQAMIGT